MHDLHHEKQAQWGVSVSARAMIWIIYNVHSLNNAEIAQACWGRSFWLLLLSYHTDLLC